MARFLCFLRDMELGMGMFEMAPPPPPSLLTIVFTVALLAISLGVAGICARFSFPLCSPLLAAYSSNPLFAATLRAANEETPCSKKGIFPAPCGSFPSRFS